ncbi:MAG: hypothetical protein ACLFNM_03635 [Candidatus Woesearchaeota archaeon]
MSHEQSLQEFEEKFAKEIAGICDVDELKSLYAKQIAHRDKQILELQKQNELLLKTAFKEKKEASSLEKRS